MISWHILVSYKFSKPINNILEGLVRKPWVDNADSPEQG